MVDLSPSETLRFRPGWYFWINHFFRGVFVLCVVQFTVLSVAPGDLNQIVAAIITVLAVVVSGARVELCIGPSDVLIRNQLTTRRIARSDIARVTLQRVPLLVRTTATNCAAIWVQGADEGWPVIATLGFPPDGPGLDVRMQLQDAPGVEVEYVANRSWRPGSYRRRRGDIES